MRIIKSFIFLNILFCTLAASARVQSSKIQDFIIHADSMFRDSENEVIELEGNVQIIFQTQHLSCNKAKINLRSKSLDAMGEVFMVSPRANIGGDRVILDYETNVGVIYNGYVQSGAVMFEGNVIHKTGDNDYLSNDARYTTCTTCPEAWNFSGTKIRAELGGYAYIKNSVMRLGGFPILWLPYLVVPLKSGRQSGLLTPSFEQNSIEGVVIGQSYFWAISRSKDATITMKNYELRGLKPLVNYRYMLSENSYGEFNGAVIQDRIFANDARLQDFQSNEQKGILKNRFYVGYSHYFELPEQFIQRTEINTGSDLQYSKDFPAETSHDGDSALESRVSFTKNTFDKHYSLDSSYYTNLLQSNPLAGNNDSVHRLPEIRVSQAQTKISDTDFLFSFDVNYVNFARNSFGYDDIVNDIDGKHIRYAGGSVSNPCVKDPKTGKGPETRPDCYVDRDGQYNTTDLIRTGQRLDIAPSISRPFQIGRFLDINPKITYRETQYYFPVDKNAQRRYLRAEIQTKTSFSRVFGDFSPQGQRLKHEIAPEITFTRIPWEDTPRHPFFGSTDRDLPYYNQRTISDQDINSPFGIQYDFNDRVYDKNLITFAITNRLTRKYWAQGQSQYLQFFSWRLAQSFDAAQADNAADNKQPWSDQSSELYLTTANFNFSNQTNNYPYHKVANTSTTVTVLNDRGDSASLTQTIAYNTTPGVPASKTSEQYNLIVKKDLGHINFVGQAIQSPEANRLKAWGYGAQIKFPGDCLYLSFFQYQDSANKRSWGFDINFNWDGEPKPGLKETLLQNFRLVN